MRSKNHRLVYRIALPLLLVLALLGLAPVSPQVQAQSESSTGFAPSGSLGLPATPDLRTPTNGVADSGPTLTASGGMAPPDGSANLRTAEVRFPPADAPPALQQSGGPICEPMLYNSTLDGGYGWPVITPNVYVSNQVYYSFSDSLWFADGNDLGFDLSPNEDMFGQDFYFPADGQSALIEFQIAYYPETQDSFDKVYYEFYLVDDLGNLVDFDSDPSDGIDPVGRGEAAQFADGEWHAQVDFVAVPSIIEPLRNQRVAFTIRGFSDNLAPFEQVYFDNIQVTVCRTTQLPTNELRGTISGTALNGALLGLYGGELATDSGGFSEIVDPELFFTTFPTANGAYTFGTLPDLNANEAYQLWYINSDATEGRLSYYAGPLVTAFNNGQANGGNFSLADIPLQAPLHYADAAFPVTFSWGVRSGQNDAYYLCIYDAESFEEVCTIEPLSSGSYTIESAEDLQGIEDFIFAYGKTYGWYVRVAGPNFDGKSFADLGASGFSQFVQFVESAETPAPPPQEEENPPPVGGADANWTILFYLAGDDADLTNPPTGTRGMQDVLTRLATVGRQFPNINLVVQFDLYETEQQRLPVDLRGTQRCYFGPNVTRFADACQQLGELNTGDPAVLSDFINAGLERYPADRTALVIMGHGSAVSGVAGDQSQPSGEPDDALRPDELEQALGAANLDQAARKLDLLVFHACLMGNFEVAALMSPFADYMVASPNIASLIDINSEILDRASSSTNAAAVATGIVADYDTAMKSYNASIDSPLSISMAAYDLKAVAAARPKVEALGAALRDNLNLEAVRSVRAAVQRYDSSAPVLWGNRNPESEDALVDLRDLANTLVAQQSLPAGLRTAALEVCSSGAGCVNSLSSLIINEVKSDGLADPGDTRQHLLTNATGLSIYFPNNSSAGNQSALTRDYLLYYRQTSFGASPWVDLVDATRTGLPTLPRRGRLGADGLLSGGTLRNFVAPELFPVAGPLPRNVGAGDTMQVYLPLLQSPR
ncbi:MAG: hypothetical protein HC822_11220 [Oscillochloris sp.]|nr:hypothetical protein [Oscillochloris sp.]